MSTIKLLDIYGNIFNFFLFFFNLLIYEPFHFLFLLIFLALSFICNDYLVIISFILNIKEFFYDYIK